MQQKAYIRGVGFHVPSRRMSNDDFKQFVDTSDEWIFSHTGIRYRHIASAEDSTSQLAEVASRKAIENAQIDLEEIDCIIVATTTPDYNNFPSTACLVQHQLDIKRPIPAFDISVACSGFVYGISLANSLIISGTYRNILLIGSEIFSRILDWKDRSTCVLFGDGAGAAIISASTVESYIVDNLLYANGHRYNSLTCKENAITMDGKEVYLFAVKTLHEIVNDIIERNDLAFDDIKWIIPHQANVRIIEATCKRGGFDRARFYMNIENYANTSSASVPIALAEMSKKGLLNRGDRLITVGFGAGLSYGANLIYW